MGNRNYNPLNEGYTGGHYEKRGYTGSNTSQAPITLPSIQSAVVKLNVQQTVSSNTAQKNSSLSNKS